MGGARERKQAGALRQIRVRQSEYWKGQEVGSRQNKSHLVLKDKGTKDVSPAVECSDKIYLELVSKYG